MIGLKVTLYSWPQEFQLDTIDAGITFELDGKSFIGRSFGPNSSTAIIKAFSEACEGYCRYTLGVESSSGLAVHCSGEAAKSHALLELIERDAFLVRYLTKSSFPELEDLKPSFYSQVASALSKIESHGGYCRIVDLGVYNHFQITGCFALAKENRKFRTSIGLGINTDIEFSAMHALLESLRNVAANLKHTTRTNSLTEQSFRDSETHGPLEHRMLCNDFHYSKKISTILGLRKENNLPYKIPKLDHKERTIEISSINPIFEGLNLYFSVIESPNIQKMFYGPMNIKNVNKARLSEYIGHSVGLDDIETLPHPIG